MAPRTYTLGKRAAHVEETRRRIIDAVVKLHGEQGIVATTYEAIAEAADVSPATVYRHFPSLDELVPACGNRILEITQPPGPQIFQGKQSLAERVETFVNEIFKFWARSRPYIEKAMAEVDRVPPLARGVDMQQRLIELLARRALGEGADDGDSLSVLLALTDFRAWLAMADHGLSESAATIVTEVILSRVQKES